MPRRSPTEVAVSVPLLSPREKRAEALVGDDCARRFLEEAAEG